jgi:hypothetical protein
MTKKKLPIEEIGEATRVASVHQIARVCHEANAAYCRSIGDKSQLPWDQASTQLKESTLVQVRAQIYALILGEPYSPRQSHDAWLTEKAGAGWVYGPEKDEAAKTHPCMVEYDQLGIEHRMKDYLFGAIVAAFYKFNADEAPAVEVDDE